jgi:hypothetical protein
LKGLAVKRKGKASVRRKRAKKRLHQLLTGIQGEPEALRKERRE